MQAVNIELIDLGTHPLAIGGVKAYETAAEEAMLEVPVQWGSNARVCVSVRVGFGGMYMNIPIEVKDIQVWSWASLLIQLSSINQLCVYRSKILKPCNISSCTAQ